MKVKPVTSGAGGNLKNRLEGNKLDLSLMGLEEIPIKDIAKLSTKATHVDLSCNRIISIPPTFCCLTSIVRLDLSKNSIANLPYDFGILVKLQYLDLYDNKIEVLPVSFAQLKALKWLDLKNNPLESHLKTVAGDCLDAKQCQTCAKKVVAFMEVVEQQLINDQKDEKKKAQVEETRRKAREEKEREKQQMAVTKKVVKEKSAKEPAQQVGSPKSPARPEKKARVTVAAAKQAQENGTKSKATQKRSVLNTEGNKASKASRSMQRRKKGARGFWRSFGLFTAVLVVLLAAGIGLALFMNTGDGEISFEAFKRSLPIVAEHAITTGSLVKAVLGRVVMWLRTDGVEIIVWLTGYALPVLADVLDICQHALAHIQNFVWGLCCKDEGAIVTTNAKTM